MPRAGKLKVYRTPIGFHDAYVAATSQKAALEAWGSDHNLFARGAAELVTDPELSREPLAHPGVVVRRSRGTAAEQIAALPASKPKSPQAEAAPPAKPAARSKPPSRAPIDAAEKRLAAAQAEQRADEAAQAKLEQELARQRRAMEKRHAAALRDLEQALADARQAYSAAIDRWQG